MNRSSLTIRKALPSDAEAIVLTHEASWLSAYCNENFQVTEEKIKILFSNKAERSARWKTRIEQLDWKKNGVWIAVNQDNYLLGFVAPKIEHDKARVGAIYVSPEAQGKGVGTSLLHEVKKLYVHRPIYLDVVSYNHRAIEFYKQNGFEPTGENTIFALEFGDNLHIEMPVDEYVFLS